MSAVEIRTRDCRVPGCTGEAEDERGPYTGLCSRHKRAKVAERSDSIRANLAKANAAKTTSPPTPKPTVAAASARPEVSAATAKSATEATRELLRLAGEVDRADAKVAKARSAHRAAVAERDAAVRAHRDALRALLGETDSKEQS